MYIYHKPRYEKKRLKGSVRAKLAYEFDSWRLHISMCENIADKININENSIYACFSYDEDDNSKWKIKNARAGWRGVKKGRGIIFNLKFFEDFDKVRLGSIIEHRRDIYYSIIDHELLLYLDRPIP